MGGAPSLHHFACQIEVPPLTMAPRAVLRTTGRNRRRRSPESSLGAVDDRWRYDAPSDRLWQELSFHGLDEVFVFQRERPIDQLEVEEWNSYLNAMLHAGAIHVRQTEAGH